MFKRLITFFHNINAIITQFTLILCKYRIIANIIEQFINIFYRLYPLLCGHGVVCDGAQKKSAIGLGLTYGCCNCIGGGGG